MSRQIRKTAVLRSIALWLLAHSSQFFTDEEMATKAGVAKVTAQNYVEALEALFLFDRVPAWSKSDYELVGLEPVKAEVRKLAAYCRMAKEREAMGLETAPVSYHFVFTGNPGTGKTTVARILAKIFHALGVLEKGQLVETDRSGLVAGYTDEMRDFINANPGLKSRFNRYLDFPDYSGPELAEMFRLRARKNQYTLTPEADAALEKILADAVKRRDRSFGNGRYARNLFEKAVERQALRLSEIDSPTKEQLTTLTLKDVGISLKDPDASDED